MWLGSCVLGFSATRNTPTRDTLRPQTPRSASLPLRLRNSELPSAMLPPPIGGTVALSSPVRYPGSPWSQGGALGIQVKSLARWPATRPCPALQVSLNAPTVFTSPAAASMRSISRGLQIPGVRGARPAPPAVPAPGARAPACGSPAPPGRPPLPGWSWAAGGAAVARRGLGGAAGRSGVRQQRPERGSRPLPPQPARQPAAAPSNGREQLAGGGAEENSEPAGAGGRRGGARGQPAARAGLREEAEGDRKGPTHRPPTPTQSRLRRRRAHFEVQGPPEPVYPCPHASGTHLVHLGQLAAGSREGPVLFSPPFPS